MKEFAHFFSQSYAVMGGAAPAGMYPTPGSPHWQPATDIYECEDAVQVVAELPGLDKDQLSVTVEKGVLRIAGYRAKNLPDSVRHVHQMEIPYGSFVRYVRLPQCTDVDQISAKYENGYLIIEVPRNRRP